jgi:hypothetical protein
MPILSGKAGFPSRKSLVEFWRTVKRRKPRTRGKTLCNGLQHSGHSAPLTQVRAESNERQRQIPDAFSFGF